MTGSNFGAGKSAANAPPIREVATKRFTIDRGPYVWALLAPFVNRTGIAGIGIGLLGAALVWADRGAARGWRVLLIILVIYGAQFLYFGLRAWNSVYGKKAKNWDSQRSFHFQDNGILIQLEGVKDSFVGWERIHHISRRRNFIFLFFSPTRHWPIANDAFRTDTDRQAFLDIAKRRGIRITRD